MKNLFVAMIVNWLCCTQAAAQLVEFDKSAYNLTDQVKVKLSYIDPNASTDSIQIYSGLLSSDNPIPINKTGWTDIGKINHAGIYNFRFRFAQDTSRYFQLAILSPKPKTFNCLTERIPISVNINNDNLLQTFTAIASGLDTLKDSNWPQLADIDTKKTSAWIIAYKAFQISPDQHQLIAGTYCLQKSEQVGANHVKAILTKFKSASVNEAFAIVSQVLMATPSLVVPMLKPVNLTDFFTSPTQIEKRVSLSKNIRFRYRISPQAKTAIYAVGIGSN